LKSCFLLFQLISKFLNKIKIINYFFVLFRIIADGKSITPLSDAILLSPITNCDKVACVGLNYSGHCDEQNVPYPKEPLIFSKFSSVIVGPNDNVVIPPITNVSFVIFVRKDKSGF